MITKKEAIAIGKAIVQARDREVLFNDGSAGIVFNLEGDQYD